MGASLMQRRAEGRPIGCYSCAEQWTGGGTVAQQLCAARHSASRGNEQAMVQNRQDLQ